MSFANGQSAVRLAAEAPAYEHSFGLRLAWVGEQLFVSSTGDYQNGPYSGAVEVFDFISGEWQRSQVLRPSDGTEQDNFGGQIAASDSVVYITAWSGIYEFRLENSSWREQAKIILPDSLFVPKGIIARGSQLIVNTGWFGASSGRDSVYVFEKNGPDWQLQQGLTLWPGPTGTALATFCFAGEMLIVGLRTSREFAGSSSGAVHVYDRSGSNNEWALTQQLTPQGHATNDYFGRGLACFDDQILVESRRNIHVFNYESGTWTEIDTLATGDRVIGSHANYLFVGDVEEVADSLGNDITHTPLKIFTRRNGTFELTNVLYRPRESGENIGDDDFGFGFAAAASSSYLAVSAPWYSTPLEEVGEVFVYTMNDVLTSQETGINRSSKIEIEVFPNPSKDFATLKYHTALPGRLFVRVFDLLGRRVRAELSFEASLGPNEANIDVHSLSTGLYLLSACHQYTGCASSAFAVSR